MKGIMLNVPEDTYRAFKIALAKLGMSQKQAILHVIEMIIEEAERQEKQERKE